ncbi:SchA/CurD-like domain-containing protein [Sinosporangium siamense]|uniref:SchA/CurD n=1 Tax=Sinosporangium siamense TaxID=1367973 RepID=A0A919V9A5_9ACTN|nr:SchA/CurD-like domain-containing protein [Sinosporangium siamense]GII95086.1 SchA/CurD [Sinosporangium siamense]
MAYAAITYKVKPGCEREITEIFADYRRPGSPFLRDAEGRQVGILLGTALFVKDDTVVRVIHYEGGTVEDVARHMSSQQGVREAERRMAPYLAESRDTQTAEGFMAYFSESTMTCVSALYIPTEFLHKESKINDAR